MPAKRDRGESGGHVRTPVLRKADLTSSMDRVHTEGQHARGSVLNLMLTTPVIRHSRLLPRMGSFVDRLLG